MTDRRLTEESFPVKEVSAISARENRIGHGHISMLHIWSVPRCLRGPTCRSCVHLGRRSGEPCESTVLDGFLVGYPWVRDLVRAVAQQGRSCN